MFVVGGLLFGLRLVKIGIGFIDLFSYFVYFVLDVRHRFAKALQGAAQIRPYASQACRAEYHDYYYQDD